jgi:uncharacterized protein YhaN
MSPTELPPSLTARPNIPFEMQTLEQLRAERDYWARCVADAGGFASANAADKFRKRCEAWIQRREQESKTE